MQFFNLSLISILAMTISAAPAMTSTITTATPIQVTTSTETVMVKKAGLANQAVQKVVGAYNGLGDKAKTGVQIGGLVAVVGTAAGLTFGAAHAGHSAWDHWKAHQARKAQPTQSADPLAYAPTGTDFYGTTGTFSTPTPTW